RQQEQNTFVDVQYRCKLPDQVIRRRAAPIMLDIVEILRRDRCAVLLFHDPCRQLLLAESHGLPGFGNLTSKTCPVSGHWFIMAWANPHNHASMRISVVARDSGVKNALP